MTEAPGLAGYVAHVLFVVAQSYFGALLILLIGPLVSFLASGEFTLGALWASFTDVWALAPKDAGAMIAAGVAAFPIGLTASEFLYRVEQWLRLHSDLNPRDPSTSASPDDQRTEFRLKCQIQGIPAYSRVYEWENFLSAFFLRTEYLCQLFCLLYSLALGVAYIDSEPSGHSIRQWLLAGIVWVLAAISLIVARKARVSKYNSLSHATMAIETLLAGRP